MNRGSGFADQPFLAPLFEPIVSNRPGRHIPGPLRVTLFNARGGVHLEGIAACFARPPLNRSSLILLCESDWGTERTDRREIASELAERLQMSFAYVPEFGRPAGDGTHKSFLGNAILSTMPLETVRAVAMPLPAPERLSEFVRRRVGLPTGLIVRARFGGRDVTVGVVHLASHCDPFERERQMATYMAEFPPHGPAIFGGDLNTTTTELMTLRALLSTCAHMLIMPWRFHSPQRYEPLFERIFERGLTIEGVNVPRRPTFTFSRAVPTMFRPKLDWIATRGLRSVPRSAAVIPARRSFFSARLSDHDFVTVELEL
ncbi:MAG: endonuclease/exonuclease/phosphatase family protein [Candidatus Binataceae bacterium]